MASVTTRQELKQYCLRNLGAPVIEINVDDDQLEDRIDEALEYWRLYHYDGIEKVYLKHRMGASSIVLTQPVATSFPLQSTVRGQTSGATARVIEEIDAKSAGTNLLVRNIVGTFSPGETILAEGTSLSAVVASVTLREFDLRYIQLNDLVYGVTRVIPFAGTQTSKSMFDIQYQLRLNDLYDLASTSIIYYKMVMSHLSLLDIELNGKPMMRFNKIQGRLYLDIQWDSDILPGNFVVVECYRALNPAEFSKVWNDPWLKHYTTALFKRAWATNLKKFSGMQLPGGVTIDGQSMYQEAVQEISDLENELMLKSAPLEFFLG